MQPTPSTPAPTPPHVGEPLVEYIRTNRQNAGSILAGLAVVLLALTAFLAIKAHRAPAEPEKPADKQLPDSLRDPDRPEPAKSTSVSGDSRHGAYMVGWIGCLIVFLGVGSIAAYLLVSPSPAEASQQRTEARIAILALGKVMGVVAILAGLILFYLWSDSLTAWLDKSETKEARWVLIPILMIVFGAGLIFLAIQPARAEERDNAVIRRTVYGANFALTVLLLTVAFVVVNVLFSLKVPNKLDTTATGFYSISDNTKNLLTRLNEPVTAYAVALDSGDRFTNDIRQLLLASQEASDGKFQVKFISEVTNKIELNSLAQKYPNLLRVLKERGSGGLPGAVVLATGDDEKRHAVIPATEFLTDDGREALFQGEARLFKEIAFLADSQSRPVIYFTQGNGELDISGTPGSPPDRAAAKLKAYLESNYLDVRPHTFPVENPSVPDDAAVVIIADPRRAVPEAAVGALRKYMTNPAKKGKLIVLASANAGPDRKVLKTGLEPLLTELNVKLGDQFIYNLPTNQLPVVDGALAVFSRSAEQNPILLAITKVTNGFMFNKPRQVEPISSNPNLQATDLLLSDGRTWLESEQITDFIPILKSFDESRRNMEARGVSDEPRSLAVIVSDRAAGPGAGSGAARAAVFGNSRFVSDVSARQARPVAFDLIGVTVDWLRDKPSIAAAGVESKKYTEYRFPQPSTVNSMRLLYLPLGLAFLTVLGLGAGVWVIRRK